VSAGIGAARPRAVGDDSGGVQGARVGRPPTARAASWSLLSVFNMAGRFRLGPRCPIASGRRATYADLLRASAACSLRGRWPFSRRRQAGLFGFRRLLLRECLTLYEAGFRPTIPALPRRSLRHPLLRSGAIQRPACSPPGASAGGPGPDSGGTTCGSRRSRAGQDPRGQAYNKHAGG